MVSFNLTYHHTNMVKERRETTRNNHALWNSIIKLGINGNKIFSVKKKDDQTHVYIFYQMTQSIGIGGKSNKEPCHKIFEHFVWLIYIIHSILAGRVESMFRHLL